MSFWCLIFKSKLEFLFMHTAYVDFCSTSVEFFIGITRNERFLFCFFSRAFGVKDSICGLVDKWSLFGVTFSHSKAINLLQSKQQLSSISWTVVNRGQGELMWG